MPHHPTLFIGLGGSGVKTLAHLKRMFYRSSKEALDQFYRFRFFDTDEANEWEYLRSKFDAEFKTNPNFIDNQTEWYSLGNFNPQARWHEVKANPSDPINRDILSWIDPHVAESFPSVIVTIGADARRQLGRFCLAHHYPLYSTKIDNALTDLNKARQDQKIASHVQIVIVVSSCGGTGSSIFFDTLYLLALIYHRLANAAPFLKPIIYSPQPYLRSAQAQNMGLELLARYNANACAFFLELQSAFSKSAAGNYNGAQTFVRPSLPDAQAFPRNWLPFTSAMILDAQREGVPSFISPLDKLYEATAEMLYYLTLSGSDTKVNSVFTNANAAVASTSHGTYPRYTTAGFRALEYPSTAIRSYLSSHFASTLVTDRFLKGSQQTSDSDLIRRAQGLVGDVILNPPHGTGLGSFRSYARRIYIDAEGGLPERVRSIDEFCEIDPSKPTAEPGIDVDQISQQRMEEAIRALHRDIENLKGSMRRDFLTQFGHPSSKDPDTYYGRVRDRLYAEMETTIEREGILAWIGHYDRRERGLVGHILNEVSARRSAAMAALAESNLRVQLLYGNAEGLEYLASTVVEQAEAVRKKKLIGVSGARQELKQRLQAFAAKRAELLEEGFTNFMLMREIELLTYVGLEAAEVTYLEYFVVQEKGLVPLLEDFKNQSQRIRDWLSAMSEKTQQLFKSEVIKIRNLASSILSTYLPPIDEIADANGEPGLLTRGISAQLNRGIEDVLGQGIFQSFTACGETAGRRWRSIRAHEGERSSDAEDLFLEGCRRWVETRLQTDPDLRATVTRSLEDYVSSLSTEEVAKLRDLMGNKNVAVFSPLSASAINRPVFRLLVTNRDADKNSLATKLGFDSSDGGQSHLINPESPQRALAVKMYSLLYLEDDFPWFPEIKHYYDTYIQINPHLHRDGRIRVQAGGSETRWRLAFALALFWAFQLQGEKWKSDAKLRSLFTTRLDTEPGIYLQCGPMLLKNRVPHLFRMDFDEAKHITVDGRLECRLDDNAFEKVAEVGQYGKAWSAFQQRSKMIDRIELFQKWSGGIVCDWSGGGQQPQIQIWMEDRARQFLGKLAEFSNLANQKRSQLSSQAMKSRDDEDTIAVLGWIASELIAYEALIRTALEGEGL
jgi:hypothetical protein